MVERFRRTYALYHGLGRCHRLRPCCCLLHQPFLLPELCHPFKLARKEFAHGRLPLCKQAELRSAHPTNATYHAINPTHHAGD